MRAFVRAAFALALLGCGDERPPEPARASEADLAKPVSPTAPEAGVQEVLQVPRESAPQPTTPAPRAGRVSKGTELRCTLRVSAKGLYVDGDPKSRAEAIAICKKRAAAMVVLEDDASQAEWKTIEAALRHEKIEILMRGPLGDADCLDNPLAKGCE